MSPCRVEKSCFLLSSTGGSWSWCGCRASNRHKFLLVILSILYDHSVCAASSLPNASYDPVCDRNCINRLLKSGQPSTGKSRRVDETETLALKAAHPSIHVTRAQNLYIIPALSLEYRMGQRIHDYRSANLIFVMALKIRTYSFCRSTKR